jgi:hypothetical protein
MGAISGSILAIAKGTIMKKTYYHFWCPSCFFRKFAGETVFPTKCFYCENPLVVRKCDCLTEDQEKACGGCENPIPLHQLEVLEQKGSTIPGPSWQAAEKI